MDNLTNSKLIEISLQLEKIILEGSHLLNKFFRTPDLTVSLKEDNTPVTPADIASSKFFLKQLKASFGLEVITEESIDSLPPQEERETWNKFWLVDPLDATQNFYAGIDEFAIIVGLIENQRPVLGGISIPAHNILVMGGPSIGAWECKDGIRQKITYNPDSPVALIPGNPSSKAKSEIESYFMDLGFKKENFKSLGSAYRSAEIARGKAGTTGSCNTIWLWDLAGAEAVLLGAGARVKEIPSGSIIQYDPCGAMNRAGYLVTTK